MTNAADKPPVLPSDLLETFASFAEDANLSRAAKRLALSQPAVHAQLRRLSELVGTPLYRRSGRGLSLTDEGTALAAFAIDTAERSRDMLLRLRGERTEDRVVLAAGAGALLHLLDQGLRAFSKSHTGRFEIVTADAHHAVDAVARGSAHVGVAALARDPADMDVTPLASVAQMLVVPRTHALANRRRVTLRDLENERMVLPPEGRPQRAVLDAAFTAHGVIVHEGATATGWELTIRLVELGLGLAVVNGTIAIPKTLTAKPLAELPRVRYVAFARPKPRANVERLVTILAKHTRHAERDDGAKRR